MIEAPVEASVVEAPVEASVIEAPVEASVIEAPVEASVVEASDVERRRNIWTAGIHRQIRYWRTFSLIWKSEPGRVQCEMMQGDVLRIWCLHA